MANNSLAGIEEFIDSISAQIPKGSKRPTDIMYSVPLARGFGEYSIRQLPESMRERATNMLDKLSKGYKLADIAKSSHLTTRTLSRDLDKIKKSLIDVFNTNHIVLPKDVDLNIIMLVLWAIYRSENE